MSGIEVPGVPESELVRRAQRGDRAAFEALVAAHTRRVLALALQIVGHREDAEDVAQEAFLRLYRSLAQVDPSRPLEAWVVRITVNAARSLRARRPQRREALPLDGGAQAEPGASAPGAALERDDLRQAIDTALATLPEREREVFILRDLQGLATVVVAEALGIAEPTVRRQSAEARRKVGAWLERHRPELLR